MDTGETRLAGECVPNLPQDLTLRAWFRGEGSAYRVLGLASGVTSHQKSLAQLHLLVPKVKWASESL